MNIEKFTDRSRGFIQAAQTLAATSNHQRLTTEHLAKVLLDDQEGLAAGLIKAAGGDVKAASEAIRAEVAKIPQVQGPGAGDLHLDTGLAKALSNAETLAEKNGDSYVTAEFLLLALVMAEGSASARALKSAGLTPQALNGAIKEMRKGRTADSAGAEAGC